MRNKCKFKVACACDLVPTFEEKQIEWIKCIYHMPITILALNRGFECGNYIFILEPKLPNPKNGRHEPCSITIVAFTLFID